MKIHETSDNILSFLKILIKMTEENKEIFFLNAVFDSLQDIFDENSDEFFDITKNSEIMDKAINIFNIRTHEDYHISSQDIEIFTNNQFHYAKIKDKNFIIIFFEKYALLKTGRSIPVLYHLNPRILQEFEPTTVKTAHQKIDIEIKLKKYFDDPKYGTLSKIIYCSLLIQKGTYEFDLRSRIYQIAHDILVKSNIIALTEDFNPKENDINCFVERLHEIIEKIYNKHITNQNVNMDDFDHIKKIYKILNQILPEIS